MGKRRTRGQIQRLLREVDRGLAKGLTLAVFCRTCGITRTSSYRWRPRFDPARIDEARRLRELHTEIEPLKLLGRIVRWPTRRRRNSMTKVSQGGRRARRRTKGVSKVH